MTDGWHPPHSFQNPCSLAHTTGCWRGLSWRPMSAESGRTRKVSTIQYSSIAYIATTQRSIVVRNLQICQLLGAHILGSRSCRDPIPERCTSQSLPFVASVGVQWGARGLFLLPSLSGFIVPRNLFYDHEVTTFRRFPSTLQVRAIIMNRGIYLCLFRNSVITLPFEAARTCSSQQ